MNPHTSAKGTHNEEFVIGVRPTMSKSQPAKEAFDRLGAYAQEAGTVPKTAIGRREAAYRKWRKALRKALRKAYA